MARSGCPRSRRRSPRAAPKSDADRIIEAALALVATDDGGFIASRRGCRR